MRIFIVPFAAIWGIFCSVVYAAGQSCYVADQEIATGLRSVIGSSFSREVSVGFLSLVQHCLYRKKLFDIPEQIMLTLAKPSSGTVCFDMVSLIPQETIVRFVCAQCDAKPNGACRFLSTPPFVDPKQNPVVSKRLSIFGANECAFDEEDACIYKYVLNAGAPPPLTLKQSPAATPKSTARAIVIQTRGYNNASSVSVASATRVYSSVLSTDTQSAPARQSAAPSSATDTEASNPTAPSFSGMSQPSVASSTQTLTSIVRGEGQTSTAITTAPATVTPPSPTSTFVQFASGNKNLPYGASVAALAVAFLAVM